ncbi:thiamine pyrophosphate-binding protein [Castellaniella sp. GW247-6E4]|uniref:thiamine pyrophosphate-binding protein n=1 Tax=Castellaniella sp. GW247-6E4 TaxID=3140380 RepID=UPI0033154A34
MGTRSGAQILVEQLAARKVRRIFGVPGGDCSLDIIQAASEAGIEFVVTRTENAAAIMASVTAELSGGIGVVLTTRGPGFANGVNGLSYAALDRAPIVMISDGYEPTQNYISHQRIDQLAIAGPLVKAAMRLEAPMNLPAVGAFLDTALSEPQGPVYLEVTGTGMRCNLPEDSIPVTPAVLRHQPLDQRSLELARSWLGQAKRPVMIAGLQAIEDQACAALRSLASRWNCPVLATYKAKGVLSDANPLMLGSYIGGAAEAPVLREADLIVLFGADPVEFPPQPWPYEAPVVEIAARPFARHYMVPTVSVIGSLAEAGTALEASLGSSAWTSAHLEGYKSSILACAEMEDGGPITPQMAARAACAALPPDARIAVDAGAHMMPVLAWFTANRPRDVLISRGLATMAFALPAALAAALEQPDRPVVAFTGDGGLMMCAAELATAVQARCNLTVVVLNDSSMTLIGVKQRRRKLPNAGVDYSASNFADVARGFGGRGFRVEAPADLEHALREAMAGDTPSLVDVVVDPEPYHAQIKAIRG